MAYKNLTITPCADGFGAKYLRCLSGLAWCEHTPRYRYVHTPMGLNRVAHFKSASEVLDDFIGIPDNRKGKRIHIRRFWSNAAMLHPDKYFDDKVTKKILDYYYRFPKPSACDVDICIHIRRGDLANTKARMNSGTFSQRLRMSSNEYYARMIPNIMKAFPRESIRIHTQGCIKDFESVTSKWSKEMKDSVDWVFDCDVRLAFHDFISCKRLFQARSCLSYSAALLHHNPTEVYFQNGPAVIHTSIEKKQWKNWNMFR